MNTLSTQWYNWKPENSPLPTTSCSVSNFLNSLKVLYQRVPSQNMYSAYCRMLACSYDVPFHHQQNIAHGFYKRQHSAIYKPYLGNMQTTFPLHETPFPFHKVLLNRTKNCCQIKQHLSLHLTSATFPIFPSVTFPTSWSWTITQKLPSSDMTS